MSNSTATKQPWEDFDSDLEEFATSPTEAQKEEIDSVLAMQMISIRMPRDLVDRMKAIAKVHGIGYQPLIRVAVERFARYEIRRILNEFEQSQKHLEELRRADCDDPEVDEWLPRKRSAIG